MPIDNPGAKGFDIKLDVQGLNENIDALSKMNDTVTRTLSMEWDNLTNQALAITTSETPVGETGNLSKSTARKKMSKYKYQIVQSAVSGPGSGGGRKNPNFPYGRAVRLGSKPPTGGTGIILPNAGNVLAWTSDLYGEVVVPMVGPPVTRKHPGITKPQDYVGSSMDKINPLLNSVATRVPGTITKNTFGRVRTGKI